MVNLPQVVVNRKKLFLSIFAVIVILLPALWFGLGHVIASQALRTPHGCGEWADNTPTNWTSDEDWTSFESHPDTENRISIRKDFNTSKWQFDSFQNVNFTSRDGLRIVGWYTEVDPQAPVVIVVHGAGSYVNGKCKPEVILTGSLLSDGGINTLLIDVRNQGYSQNVSDYFYIGQKEYNDVLGAYDWLIEEHDYSPSSIGVTGISTGALSAIYAFDKSDMGSMWLESAITDFPLLVKNELSRLGYPEFLASPAITMGSRMTGVDFTEMDALDAASRIGDRSVYLVHGKEDSRISVDHSQNFHDIAISNDSNSTIWIIDDGGHVDGVWEYTSEYQAKMVEFFSSSLTPKSNSLS